MKLPPPSCPQGYTTDDLHVILGERYPEFLNWHAGQTGSICDGRLYDYDAAEYRATPCAGDEHGMVTYGYDLQRFLRGLGDLEWVGL